jgi:hypothetical protein
MGPCGPPTDGDEKGGQPAPSVCNDRVSDQSSNGVLSFFATGTFFRVT